ncbi:villin-2-like isoform X1 [Carex littledalei]|uniref:Villin-2-like isoform X1 n=1 Tax=Carex littledalei TaxID=544730 RepID=A0A833VFK9_9POAL|nr:villin-2-like isoform X1 [Carex littledalei]
MVTLKKSNSEKLQDPAFQSVGQKIGTEIWRIENFQLVPLQESDHGKFYSGDSYIVLWTSVSRGAGYAYDIHFWIGKHSTPDEYGTAAIKTIELGEILGGRAIQHREVQGHESHKFLSYFKPCIIPLQGGFASGFRRHEKKYEIQLYVCRGNRVVRMNQVPVALSSLNHDNIFILDTESKIYQFNGKTSSIQERAKALEVIPYLRDKFHMGRRSTFAIVELDSESREFWAYFGGFAPIGEKAFDENEFSPKTTAPAIYRYFVWFGPTHQLDSNFNHLCMTHNIFFSFLDLLHFQILVVLICLIFSINNGQMKLEESMDSNGKLDSHKCYLLDCGSELFLWVGKLAPVNVRIAATRIVKDFIERENRSNNTCITRIVQGYETIAFKSKFDSWSTSSDMALEECLSVNGNSANAPSVEEAPQLLEGGGKLEVWHINNSSKISVSKEEMGKFYSGDCYIVLYKYQSIFKKEENFLACWIGKNSAQVDQNMASQLASSSWDASNGKFVQGHIYEGKEPPQFIALFQTMIVLMGGLSSSYKKLIEEKKLIDRTYSSDGMALIQITSTSFNINKAIQVDAVVESLCSNDCFLLQTGDSIYVWQGHSSTVEQQQLAEDVANYLKKYIEHAIRFEGLSPEVPLYRVTEGNEPCFFTSYFPSWDVTKAMCEGNSYEKKLKLLKKIARTFTMISREKSTRYRKPSAKWIAVQSSFKNAKYSPKLPMDSGSEIKRSGAERIKSDSEGTKQKKKVQLNMND